MVPVGFDERHEGLARVGEVGDHFANQYLQYLARLAGQRIVVGVHVGATDARNLLVQRGVDVKQCTGDIEQRAFVGAAIANHDRAQRVPLLLHDIAGDAETEHAEGIGYAREGFGLRLQAGDVALAGAQMQVERVLDPKQVFLDRSRDGIE